MDVAALQRRLQEFADQRNWEQYHNPKNLAMALSSEAGELVELFQWLTGEESKAERLDEQVLQSAREELADVMIYLLRLADKLGVDLEAAVIDKIAINDQKYPVHLAKDNAVKYSRREQG